MVFELMLLTASRHRHSSPQLDLGLKLGLEGVDFDIILFSTGTRQRLVVDQSQDCFVTFSVEGGLQPSVGFALYPTPITSGLGLGGLGRIAGLDSNLGVGIHVTGFRFGFRLGLGLYRG